MKMTPQKWLYVAIGAIAIIGTVIVFLIPPKETTVPIISINSFEECAAAGYPIMESYPERCAVPGGQTFVRQIEQPDENIETLKPLVAAFGKSFSVSIGQAVNFSDGLKITLKEINDSRCKPGVQCIWAGELSPVLLATGGNFGIASKEIRLGTSRNNSVQEGNYDFILNRATEQAANLTVSSKSVSVDGGGRTAAGYIAGHVNIGPFCPVEREGVPCPVPPEAYTSREVLVYSQNGANILERANLDKDGNFKIAIQPGTYLVQIAPAGIGPGEKKSATVKSFETTTVNFDIDTGIR